MTPRVGEWWTMDKRGQGTAHLVATIIPALHPDPMGYDYSRWIPACQCVKTSTERIESASLFSTRDRNNPHCDECAGLREALIAETLGRPSAL